MKKLFTSIFLVLALLAMTAGTAFAQETTPLTGTVQSVAFEIDPATGDTTVVVELLDETTGETQTVKISLETAESLGLVTTDPITGESTIADDAVGKAVEIDPANVIEDGEEEEQEQEHPVGSALAEFFGELLGVDVSYDTIMSYRNGENGNAGFGVIAQALWMTSKLQNDLQDANPDLVVDGNALFQQIVEAKLYKDYTIELADGTTIEANNWGQFRKQILDGDKKNSLGDVMSDKNGTSEDTGEDTIEATGNAPGNGNNGNNGDKGKDNGKDNGKDKEYMYSV